MKTELISMAIANFERIIEHCARITSGNAAHQAATIKGIAGRTAEYLKKYAPEREKAINALKMSCLHKSRNTGECTLGMHGPTCNGDCGCVKGFLKYYDNEA